MSSIFPAKCSFSFYQEPHVFTNQGNRISSFQGQHDACLNFVSYKYNITIKSWQSHTSLCTLWQVPWYQFRMTDRLITF